MVRHFWVMLPILAALLLGALFARVTAPSALDAARTRWDARPFTRYHMLINYTYFITTCMQDLFVDGEQVLSVRSSVNCDEQEPIPGIEYPTVDDIFDHLQAQATLLARQTNCLPQRQMGVTSTYDNLFGYPLHTDTGWIFNNRWRFNPLNLNIANPRCIGGMTPENIIEILSLTPQ